MNKLFFLIMLLMVSVFNLKILSGENERKEPNIKKVAESLKRISLDESESIISKDWFEFVKELYSKELDLLIKTVAYIHWAQDKDFDHIVFICLSYIQTRRSQEELMRIALYGNSNDVYNALHCLLRNRISNNENVIFINELLKRTDINNDTRKSLEYMQANSFFPLDFQSVFLDLDKEEAPHKFKSKTERLKAYKRGWEKAITENSKYSVVLYNAQKEYNELAIKTKRKAAGLDATCLLPQKYTKPSQEVLAVVKYLKLKCEGLKNSNDENQEEAVEVLKNSDDAKQEETMDRVKKTKE